MKKTTGSVYHILLTLLCIFLCGTITGCSLSDRGDFLARENRDEKKMADDTIQSVLNALDAKNTDALRKLFSEYALENSRDITYVLTPKYHITHEGQTYDMFLTMYIENDTQPERIGLHSIQVMTEDAKPEGFKWRDEEDAPGIYVLE